MTGPAGDSLVNQNGGWSLHWGGGQDDSQFLYGSTIYCTFSILYLILLLLLMSYYSWNFYYHWIQ